MKPITTTLKKIREHRPCGLERGSGEGYDLLRKNLGKGYGDNTPIKFSQIVESNGLDDALWCLRSICPEHDREVRLLAADFAESVLHIFERERPDDDRPRKAIQAARDFANGKINKDQLAAARAAAGDAALALRAPAWGARDAAWATVLAARTPARDAVLAAASAVERATVWVAVIALSSVAAGYAARDAEVEKQTKLLIERFG